MEIRLERLKNPAAGDVLTDGERLAALYRRLGSVHRVADEIGCGSQAVLNWLHYHGIEVQKRGGGYKGRARVNGRKAQILAYLDDDRCPPDCPGRENCLDRGCTMVARAERWRRELARAERGASDV